MLIWTNLLWIIDQDEMFLLNKWLYDVLCFAFMISFDENPPRREFLRHYSAFISILRAWKHVTFLFEFKELMNIYVHHVWLTESRSCSLSDVCFAVILNALLDSSCLHWLRAELWHLHSHAVRPVSKPRLWQARPLCSVLFSSDEHKDWAGTALLLHEPWEELTEFSQKWREISLLSRTLSLFSVFDVNANRFKRNPVLHQTETADICSPSSRDKEDLKPLQRLV